MAYQAFYNKYRPQTFDEVVGQKAIVSTLKNAIKEDKIAHAYLFCGPRGTGKTSMARLFAKALDCQEGLGHQCNKCNSCLSIIKGEHPDVIEIDAASNSTVDSVRQLIENVSYQPLISNYKVYIIDEVHNMSNAAFNALLKTLEEPPSFVVFILATTEPQKLLPTILSRVQRFDFSKVTEADLVANMKRVLDNEHIEYDEKALKLIASLSDGGVRDSLSLLDKVVSYCDDKVTVADVDEMLGLLSKEDEIKMVESISHKEIASCLKLVREKYSQGMDINRLNQDLINIYKDYIIYSSTKDPSLLSHLEEKEVRDIDTTYNQAKYNLDILLKAKRESKNSEDLLASFELALISLMQDKVIVSETKVIEKEENKEDSLPKLDSKPIEIKSEKKENGFVSSNVAVNKTNDPSKITYSLNDIALLMNIANKDERVKIDAKWPLLETLTTSNNAYEALALYSSKARLVTPDIILVSNRSLTEIEKINKKETQKVLVNIIETILEKKYHILPVTEDEFKQAYTIYKNKSFESDKINIDFGKEEDTSSTNFMNDLMGV